ncbi:hypothetical protein SAMN02745152_02215, partial [Treponema berlinense]
NSLLYLCIRNTSLYFRKILGIFRLHFYCILSKDEFKTTYDEVEDITFITHKDMQKGAFYNLKDSATGERENISLYISDKSLTIWADYQNNDWMFIDGIVFLDADSNRLKIDYGKRTESDVKTGAIKNVYVREDYGAIIKEEDISNLENILSSSKVYVAFLGKKNTKKMELKAKYIKAMQATIEKWKSINEKIEE